jgi:hypothetical protein
VVDERGLLKGAPALPGHQDLVGRPPPHGFPAAPPHGSDRHGDLGSCEPFAPGCHSEDDPGDGAEGGATNGDLHSGLAMRREGGHRAPRQVRGSPSVDEAQGCSSVRETRCRGCSGTVCAGAGSPSQ